MSLIFAGSLSSLSATLESLRDEEVNRIDAELETFRHPVSARVMGGTLENTCNYAQDVCRDSVRELFGFLTLKVLAMDTDATLLSPSGPIDDMWHKVVLDTKLYREICDAILPEWAPSPRMLDHNPQAPLGHVARYQRTLDTYAEVFGEEAPSKWWPAVWELQPEPTIEIFVQTIIGKTCTWKRTHPSATVDVLKRKIQVWVGIPPDQQRMIFNGTELEDGRTLRDYDVKEKSVLRVSWPAEVNPTPQLFVKYLSGKTITVAYDLWDSVEGLKQKVLDVDEDMPLDRQRLIFMGRQLEDGDTGLTLVDYNIHENSTVCLVPRLRGC